MAGEKVVMSSSTRRVVLWISAPVIVFAIVGGFLGKVTAREDTYPAPSHLRRRGQSDHGPLRREARHGQGIVGRDARARRQPRPRQRVPLAGPGEAGRSQCAGPDRRRRHRPDAAVLPRVIATRDGSPAAKAGLRTGDYVRVIDEHATREMSVFEGMRRAPRRARLEDLADGHPRQHDRSARAWS